MAVLLVAGRVFAAGLEGCEEHVRFGAPSLKGDLLCREGYALSHDPERKVPSWVAYHMTRERLQAPATRRTNKFQPDPDLRPGKRAELADYRGSGFDRGHMAPAADMKWSRRAMEESFYLSNMAPQVGVGFNRGIWAALEDLIRRWALDRGELYVVTGPVYADDAPHRSIGARHVAVPTHFYQVVFDPAGMEAIAFVLPNRRLEGATLPSYATSVEAVEKLTGLDFLNDLDDTVERTIEAKVPAGLW